MNTVFDQINTTGKAFVEFALPMLIQSSGLIAVLLLADFALRKRVRAAFRYWMWILVPAQLVLPGLASLLMNLRCWIGARAAYAGAAVEPVAAEARVGATASVTWQGAVLLIWLAVVVCMAVFLFQRAILARRLVATAKKANYLMNGVLWYCRTCMGVKGEIRLKVSTRLASPAVWGLFRPVILVPHDLAPSLGSRHLRSVLLHELAHIKRRDLWVNLVQTVLQTVYFYNPLLWLANRRIRRVREQAVDEVVVTVMGEKAQWYPETLVNVSKRAFRRPVLSLDMIGVVESKKALAGRLKHLANRRPPKSG
ncbi:MAG: M56 family metallopeptidase [Planctomycetota bacterium]|jgi:bla regulator protein BlaR1